MMQAELTQASPLGMAIVGTGFGQKVHIPAFNAHNDIELRVIYHRDLHKAQEIAQAHHIPSASDSLDQILARPDIHGVSIATPPFLHAQMATAVLRAGKHLFLEKPMALNVTEAKALYQLIQQQGLHGTLNFEFRYVPAWMHLQTLLAENYLGQPRLIKIDWLVPGRADPSLPWSWHGSKDLGGGSLGALGSHSFDYIAWLLGPIQRLTARLVTTIPMRSDHQGRPQVMDADDTCALTLELASGACCQLTISATTYAGRGHWLEIYGDRGSLVLGSDHPQDYIHGFQLWGAPAGAPLEKITIPDGLEFPTTYTDGRIAPTIRVIDHWVQQIRQGQAAAPSLKEGVYSQLLMDLAHQSHQTGCWVDVPDLETFLAQP